MGDDWGVLKSSIAQGIPESLPAYPAFDSSVDHAPARSKVLDNKGVRLALRNALRYFKSEHHEVLAKEFLQELNDFGRIIMRRFRPTEYDMRAYPIEAYPCKSKQAAAIMLMIQNNLDPAVAQFPHELITYGGNGSVFQNWAQYLLTMKYLSNMNDNQTLVMYSGHPIGLFPSSRNAPRVVITNGMVIPNYSTGADYELMNSLGVSQYGQMTAGSYMYIGPQGIVHGTTITLLNAARLHLKLAPDKDLSGVTFVTSGLGGMSGAQAKAAVISGAACIVGEINEHAAKKRYQQGWLTNVSKDLDESIDLMLDAAKNGKPISIGYVGNIVDLWERIDQRGVVIDLGSDQTSLHNPYQGGYFPTGINFDKATKMMSEQPKLFAEEVDRTLRKHAEIINRLSSKGMFFWDYGNAFLLQASRAGADILEKDGSFRYPSYVEDIMGPICFDYGFGPFRWVCTSGDPVDLRKTDDIAAAVLREMLQDCPTSIRQQLADNIRWIEQAGSNDLVVGSQARILYANDLGRRNIAMAINKAIASGDISAPVVLGRDHHDVSGTDSPYRETANIKDGSMFTADMAVQNFVGDSFRGATWVSLHNGGGVGWGEVINGGFGMVIDGSEESEIRIQSMLHWDVNNGVARRAWARNPGAIEAIKSSMHDNELLVVTLPEITDDAILDDLLG